MPKNPKLNCKLNTGHIHMIKGSLESYELQLSNKPRNAKIEEKLVNLQSD